MPIKKRGSGMKRLQNATLLLCALLFSVLLCEGMFYLLDRISPSQGIKVVDGIPNEERLEFFHYHPVYGYSGQANVSKEFYGKQVTHNSKGMRGPEIDYSSPEDVSRIAFIGDSQTWGWAVSDSETIPFFASHILNEFSSGTTFESLNFGATGYGIDQSYLRFISEGLRYKPDYVVLTYFADNDIWETGASEAWGVEKPFFFEKSDGKMCVSNIPPKRAIGWPLDNIESQIDLSFLNLNIAGINLDLTKTNTVKYFRNRSINSSLLGTWDANDSDILKTIENHIGCIQKEPAPKIWHWDEKINLTVKLIDLIRNTAEENGAKFLVVTKPLENDYENDTQEQNYQVILSHLEDLNIEVLDLYSEFKKNGSPTEALYQGAGHLTSFGNWLTAESVANRIVKDDQLAGKL